MLHERSHRQDDTTFNGRIDTQPATHEGFLNDSTNRKTRQSAADALVKKSQTQANRSAPPPPISRMQQHTKEGPLQDENVVERRAVMPLLDAAAARSVIIATGPSSPSAARSPPSSWSPRTMHDEGSPLEMSRGSFADQSPIPNDFLATVSKNKEGSAKATGALPTRSQQPTASVAKWQPHQRVTAYPTAPSFGFHPRAVYMQPQSGMYGGRIMFRTPVVVFCLLRYRASLDDAHAEAIWLITILSACCYVVRACFIRLSVSTKPRSYTSRRRGSGSLAKSVPTLTITKTNPTAGRCSCSEPPESFFVHPLTLLKEEISP